MTIQEVFEYLKGEYSTLLANSQEGHSIVATIYVYDTYSGEPEEAKLIIDSVTVFYVKRAHEAEAKPFYNAAEAVAYFVESDSPPPAPAVLAA